MSAPGRIGVASDARAPSTKTFMCRRIAGRSSQMRAAMPGWRASSAATRSATVLMPSIATSAAAPGNRVTSSGDRRTRAGGRRAGAASRFAGRFAAPFAAPFADRRAVLRHAAITMVSTEAITGRFSAIRDQLAPSSRLA